MKNQIINLHQQACFTAIRYGSGIRIRQSAKSKVFYLPCANADVAKAAARALRDTGATLHWDCRADQVSGHSPLEGTARPDYPQLTGWEANTYPLATGA